MELIPYTSREGREIVLRHRNALIVRDPSSQRLEVRGVALRECPTCQQPLRSSSPEHHFDVPNQHESYVNPNYFRMLRAGYSHDGSNDDGSENTQYPAPSSPIRRLTQPTLPGGHARPEEEAEAQAEGHGSDEAEFLSSTPAPQEGARIRRDAFSPDYFQRFFVEERVLGRGGKGVVLLVRHEIDGCPLGHFACKRVPVGDDHAWLEKVLIEVELLANLSHPNLVSYRHVWLEDVRLHRFGPSVACAFILQQYCNGGDLLCYIVGNQPTETTKEQLKAQMRRRSKGHAEMPHDLSGSPRRLSPEDLYSLFKDITTGLAYLHGANYIHRDLKPSNCLLHRENGSLTCLISDFGEVQPGNAVRKSTGTTGTISYCAPEVLTMDSRGRFGNFTTKSDVFSLGMILYFLCFGRLPYRNANIMNEELEDVDLLRAEISGWKGFQDERRERPDLPSKLYRLLKTMLALEPAQRPSATEVLSMINNESNLGGLRGGTRSASPSPGLHIRRIQSLDSPLVPGTPQPGPSKARHGAMTPEDDSPSADETGSPAVDDSPQPTWENSLQKYSSPTGTPRHPPQTMALTWSQDRLHPSHLGRSHGTRNAQSHLAPTAQTPLLMPPPTGPFGALKQQARLSWHYLSHRGHSHADQLVFLLRFGLFLVKVASLAEICWPFMISLGVGLPLAGLAGLDLGLQSGGGFASGLHREHGSRSSASAAPSSSMWGWRVSCALLVLHFSALWSLSRWEGLCASTRHD
ncbi:kinase-like protein [Xylariaceae sp. FL0804]|nr:kinase-like protein [Xylariaceae sp. FL0804]